MPQSARNVTVVRAATEKQGGLAKETRREGIQRRAKHGRVGPSHRRASFATVELRPPFVLLAPLAGNALDLRGPEVTLFARPVGPDRSGGRTFTHNGGNATLDEGRAP